METPEPIRVRLTDASTQAQDVRVVTLRSSWVYSPYGADKSSRTYGQVINDLFFRQPVALSFDPLHYNDENDLPEEGVTFRDVWKEPAAAIIWMAIGSRSIRSQYFRCGALNLGKALRLGIKHKGRHTVIEAVEDLVEAAQRQFDEAYWLNNTTSNHWKALWDYLSGRERFYYRVALGENYLDHRAEYEWLSPSSLRSIKNEL